MDTNKEVDSNYTFNELKTHVEYDFSVVLEEVHKNEKFMGLYFTLTKVKSKKENKVTRVFYPIGNNELYENYHNAFKELGLTGRLVYSNVKRYYLDMELYKAMNKTKEETASK